MNLQYNYEKAYLEVKGLPCTWRLYLKPKPYAHSKLPGSDWRPDNPEFRILPETVDESDLSMTLFRSDIPENYAMVIAPFPSHQWMLLRMLYEGPACLEPSLSNLVLAFCTANNAEFRAKPEDRISILGKLCLKKQKELLDWLGFPGTPSTVRLFQKIVPEAVNPSILRMFRAALKITEFLKTLGHIRQINAGVLALVTNKTIAGFLTPKLLLEASEMPEEREASPLSDLLFETCSMFRTVRARHETKKPVFESVAGIQAVHDELIPRYNEIIMPPVVPQRGRRRVKRRTDQAPSKFWNPPILGTSDIMPITSPKELYREGCDMHHCAGAYRSTIQDGRMYIYKVLNPERATLAIRPNPDGIWFISQLKGVCNQKVSIATRQAVKEWLNQGNMELQKQGGTEGTQATPDRQE